MKSLDGEIVLLTGAAGGFGRALLPLLLAEGCQIIVAERDRADLRGIAASGCARGNVIGCIAADLSDAGGADALYAAATRVSPRIDILVNNAGIGMIGRFDQIPRAEWERLMQVNLLAPMRLTALALPEMIARRHGHIVNIASLAGIIAIAGFGPYASSKFGLRGFGEALAADLRGSNVDVTTIYPWFARTAILDAPQYGRAKPRKVPHILLDNPAMVMRALVDGIRRRRQHIYPGSVASLAAWLKRYAPWTLM
jgi:short-subunit dehydrogenase